MSRRIAPTDSLERLKREAKRWLKALRENVEEARVRLAEGVARRRRHTDAPQHPARARARARDSRLDRAQGASLRSRVRPAASPRTLVSRFLDNACPDHHVRGGPDHVRARGTAMRLLERYPEIANASFYTKSRLRRPRRRPARPRRTTRSWRGRVTPRSEARGREAGRSRDLLLKDLGSEGLDAAPLSVLHAPAARRGGRQRRRDRARLARSRRRPERLLHGRQQPLHAARRRDRRRRRGSPAAPEARRARSPAARPRRRVRVLARRLQRPGHLQHPFPRKRVVVPEADARVLGASRPRRRLGRSRVVDAVAGRLRLRRAVAPVDRRREQRPRAGRVVSRARGQPQRGPACGEESSSGKLV